MGTVEKKRVPIYSAGVDKETPSILAITREFMGRMTTEEQLAM
eukprot:COSAG06_NODE_30364_length_540_cov_0.807256_1_plen_43_part_00